MEHKQPQSLFECALHMVGMIITKSALNIFDKYNLTEQVSAEERRDLESTIARTAENFDRLIPKPLHDIVTQHSLLCLIDFEEKLDTGKDDLNILDIVLRSHIKELNTFGCPFAVHNLLYRSLPRLKNLQYLMLEGIWPIENIWPDEDILPGENLICMTRAIKDLKMLESFECCYCCDDIVKALCNNLNLRKLDIYLSWNVTDLSRSYILSIQNLNYLNITGCHLSKESCVQILSGLPHLLSVSSDYLHSYLAQINDDKVQLPYQAVQCSCYSQEDMVNLIKYCPLITKLDLLNTTISDLSSLASLNHLKSLKVRTRNSHIEFNDIKSFLESKGHQLIKLHLYYFTDKSTTTENVIRSLCPNLKDFSLESYFYDRL